jgi:hypothetical protein
MKGKNRFALQLFNCCLFLYRFVQQHSGLKSSRREEFCSSEQIIADSQTFAMGEIVPSEGLLAW